MGELTDDERDLLRRTAAFTRAVLRCLWDGFDLDGADIQDLGEKHRVIIKTKFDPRKHDDQDGVAEEGDDWFVETPGLATATLPQHPQKDTDDAVR